METNKKDTRWMVSVALMAAIVILLANTPLGMIQLPIIKATTVHIPVIVGAILCVIFCRSDSRSGFRHLFSDQQYYGAYAFILCVLAFFKHYRTGRSSEGHMDFGGLPYSDRSDFRMAVDPVQKDKAEYIFITCHYRIYRLHGEYCFCNGKYLFSVCPGICQGSGSCRYSSFRSDHGNCYGLRHSGSSCRGSVGGSSWKGTFESISGHLEAAGKTGGIIYDFSY